MKINSTARKLVIAANVLTFSVLTPVLVAYTYGVDRRLLLSILIALIVYLAITLAIAIHLSYPPPLIKIDVNIDGTTYSIYCGKSDIIKLKRGRWTANRLLRFKYWEGSDWRFAEVSESGETIVLKSR